MKKLKQIKLDQIKKDQVLRPRMGILKDFQESLNPEPGNVNLFLPGLCLSAP